MCFKGAEKKTHSVKEDKHLDKTRDTPKEQCPKPLKGILKKNPTGTNITRKKDKN